LSLVSTLGEEIRTIVRTVGQNPGSDSTEDLTTEDPIKCGTTEKKKGKKVTIGGPPLEHEE
jgi:hypothetical protein